MADHPSKSSDRNEGLPSVFFKSIGASRLGFFPSGPTPLLALGSGEEWARECELASLASIPSERLWKLLSEAIGSASDFHDFTKQMSLGLKALSDGSFLAVQAAQDNRDFVLRRADSILPIIEGSVLAMQCFEFAAHHIPIEPEDVFRIFKQINSPEDWLDLAQRLGAARKRLLAEDVLLGGVRQRVFLEIGRDEDSDRICLTGHLETLGPKDDDRLSSIVGCRYPGEDVDHAYELFLAAQNLRDVLPLH